MLYVSKFVDRAKSAFLATHANAKFWQPSQAAISSPYTHLHTPTATWT